VPALIFLKNNLRELQGHVLIGTWDIFFKIGCWRAYGNSSTGVYDLHKHDEISSTEKLLDLIRGKRNAKAKPPRQTRSKGPSASFFSLRKIFSFQKAIIIGADIGSDELKLLKVRQISDQKPEVLDYRIIPLESHIFSDKRQLSNMLHTEMKRFCGASKKNVRIWSVISTSGFQPRYLRIPKVSKKQTPDAVYWAYKKNTSFEEKGMIFDFQVLGDITENGVRKTEVIAYAVSEEEVEQVRSLFSKSAFPLKGISAYPFFFQNLFRTQCAHTASHHMCNLYLGKTGSRIDIFSPKGYLILSRSIKAGMDSMIEAIKDHPDAKPASFAHAPDIYNLNLYEIADKKAVSSTDQAEQIFFSLFGNTALREKRGLLSEADIFQMILPALKRLTRQLEITIEHYASNFYHKPVERLYISGEIGTSSRFTDYIGSRLKIPTAAIDPFDMEISVFRPPHPARRVPPEKKSERLAFAPAAGMSLSDDSVTPNFIFTHKAKQKFARIRRIQQIIYACFFLIAMGCVGIYYHQGYLASEKRATLAQLRQEMRQYTPRVNQNLILQKVSKIKRAKKKLKAYGKKYLSVAAISELSVLTPSGIRLTHMTLSLGKLDKAGGEGGEELVSRTVALKGIILGEPMALESTLAGYLAGLKKSPLFNNPAIKNSVIALFQDQKVLRFDVELDLI